MTPLPPSSSSLLSSLRTWADRPVTDGSRRNAAIHYLARTLLITAAEFKNSELSLRASALTFTILLSLVPLLAMSTAVVKGLGGGDQLRQAAYSYIASLEKNNGFAMADPADNLAPMTTRSAEQTGNLTGHLRLAADRVFAYVDSTNFATLGTIGVVGMLFSVLLMLGHIESAMNAIWKVSAARSVPRKIADYLTLMVLLPISINIAFAASAFLKSPVLASKMDRLIPFDWLQSLLLKPVPIFFIALSFYMIYIFFPNTRVKTVPAMIGAILAAFLWFMVQNMYITLQLGLARYNAIYGSFATLPLFLVWMYFGWVFILTGAQVAFAMQNVRTYQLEPLACTPSLKLAAAFDIMDRIHAAFAAGTAIQARKLAADLPHYLPRLVEETVDELLQGGALHILHKDQRLLPISPLEQYARQDIVRIILGTDAPGTSGGILSRKAIEAAESTSGQPDPAA